MLFPFSAVVGQSGLKLALQLLAVDPGLGGVLIQGEKGTAKTTTVRGLAALLPGAGERSPFVELPLGATEDRVVGSIDVESLVSEGQARLNPGLMSDADGGVLYVDEVNLLADHLVDVLLDAAATGQLTVERDGVSAAAPARFALVGTMNPEEGEIRPQLLDRFGLSVNVTAPTDPQQRVAVVTRRLEFDTDPERFCASFADAEADTAKNMVGAQQLLEHVVVPVRELRRIALVCLECEVQGLRADVVTARAAKAHAALAGRTTVTVTDVRAVASFVLPHRRRRDPFDPMGMSEAEIDAAFAAAQRRLDELDEDEHDEGGDTTEPSDRDQDNSAQQPQSPEVEGEGNEESGGDEPDDGDDGSDGGGSGPEGQPQPLPPVPEQAAEPAEEASDGAASAETSPPNTEPPRGEATGGSTGHALAAVRLTGREGGAPTVFRVAGRGRGSGGRRSTAITAAGRSIPAEGPGDGAHLDLPGTIRAAARENAVDRIVERRRQRANARQGALTMTPAALRYAHRLGRSGDLVAFCVDTSGSMAARRRLELVAESAAAVLRDAYVRRDVVGVVTAGGHGAVTALAPTRSVDLAIAALNAAPTGGRTPLAEGIEETIRLVRIHRLREPDRRAIVLVLTDGRATAGAAAHERALAAARHLGAMPGVAPVVVDCESGRIRLGGAAQLAAAMHAPCMPLAGLTAGGVTELVRAL